MRSPSSNATRPLWSDVAPRRYGDTLGSVRETDVCVVGGGIAGLSVAERVLADGRSVVVLDDGYVGGGETARTSAHLTSAVDDRFVDLERMHGERGAAVVAQSHATAIDWIEHLCERYSIDCDFRRVDGYLFSAGGTSAATFDAECEAAQRAGLDATLVRRAPIASFDTGPAIRFAQQAQFHPTAYVRALAELVFARKGSLQEQAHVSRVEQVGPTKVHVHLSDGRLVVAKHVVIATNSPITSRVALPLEQSARRTYVVAFRIAKNAIPALLLWDDGDPYHYVRVVDGPDHDVLIVGGEDHGTGRDTRPSLHFDRLAAWTRARFPNAGDVVASWSGQIHEPADHVGFVGPWGGPNLFVVSGDSGDGLTLGVLAGFLIADQIAGRPNAWADVYAPERSVFRAAPLAMLRENVQTAVQYGDLLQGGEVSSADAIPADSGAVVRHGLSLLAVHRDAAGVLHACSAVCPHLYGVVHWNAVEKTWDCPCHGSRFDCDGHVLNGPAVDNLASFAAPDDAPSPSAR